MGNAFTDGLDALFTDPNFGADATYLAPSGGAAVPCRLVFVQPDDVLGAGLAVAAPARHADIRVSQVAVVEEKGVVTLVDAAGAPIAGQSFRVRSPRQPDDQRWVWRFGLVLVT